MVPIRVLSILEGLGALQGGKPEISLEKLKSVYVCVRVFVSSFLYASEKTPGTMCPLIYEEGSIGIFLLFFLMCQL